MPTFLPAATRRRLPVRSVPWLALTLIVCSGVTSARAALIVHLAADQIDTGDSNQIRITPGSLRVQQWNDVALDATADHAQQGATFRQPEYVSSVASFNGRPAIRFDGVDDYLQIAHRSALDPGSGQYTVFLVGQTNDLSSSRFWMHKGNANVGIDGFTVYTSAPNPAREKGIFGPGGRPALLNVRGTSSTTSAFEERFLATTEPVLISFTFTGNELAALLDDDGSGTVASDNEFYTGSIATSDPLLLGTRLGSSLFLDGYLAELMIFDGPLSYQQHRQATTYLNQKYALFVPEPASLTMMLVLSLALVPISRRCRRR